ncbi:hypothetical protein F5B20DRAFT_421449 [Whalleya microplaca]|nr:hypothetical protein F5B20DRAFT_421449 [Whalleya microplaca]
MGYPGLTSDGASNSIHPNRNRANPSTRNHASILAITSMPPSAINRCQLIGLAKPRIFASVKTTISKSSREGGLSTPHACKWPVCNDYVILSAARDALPSVPSSVPTIRSLRYIGDLYIPFLALQTMTDMTDLAYRYASRMLTGFADHQLKCRPLSNTIRRLLRSDGLLIPGAAWPRPSIFDLSAQPTLDNLELMSRGLVSCARPARPVRQHQIV